jgi:hypothetical protein
VETQFEDEKVVQPTKHDVPTPSANSSPDWQTELSAPDVGLATRMLLRVLLLGALGTFSLAYLSWYMFPIGVVLMGLCFYGLQVISYDCNRACYLPWSGANTLLGAAVSLPLLRASGPIKIGSDPLESVMFAATRHAPVWLLAVGISITAIANGYTLTLLKFWLIPFLAMHLSAAGSFFFLAVAFNHSHLQRMLLTTVAPPPKQEQNQHSLYFFQK